MNQKGESPRHAQPWLRLHLPTALDPERWAELTVPIASGDLAGWTAKHRVTLQDGYLQSATIELHPPDPPPLWQTTMKALGTMTGGDPQRLFEDCLQNIVGQVEGMAAENVLPWLNAVAATRKRPGRAGTAPLLWAQVAARRVEAEEQEPGNAIRYMRRTWPEEFTSDSAVWGKVNKARKHGMIEFTDEGPRLTDEARRLLEGS